MSSQLLLQNFSEGAVIGWRKGAAITADEFLAVAHTLAKRMPAGVRCMNLCNDRLNFALGLAAALIRGNPTLLPPNRVPAVLSEIAADAGPVYRISDHDSPLLPPAEMDLSHWPRTMSAHANPWIANDQPAIIAYTSGTTGKPSPHTRNWRSYVEGATALAARLPLKPGAVLLGTVPPQHMWGLEASILLAFQGGHAIHPASPLLPAEICSVLAQTPGESWLVTTPVHLRALVLSGEPLPPLGGVLVATAPLDAAIARALEAKTGSMVFEIFGTTETGALATRPTARTTRYQFLDDVRADTIIDRHRVQGGHVHQPVILHDQLQRIEGAYFDLEGRLSDMVKIGGKRASLSALNLELNAIAGVVDGIFYLPERASNPARLTAFVVAPGLSTKDIIAALRQRIDPVFLPRPLVLVDQLPRNAAGKLTRDSVADLAAQTREVPLAEPS